MQGNAQIAGLTWSVFRSRHLIAGVRCYNKMNDDEIDRIMIQAIASLYPNSKSFNPKTIRSKTKLSQDQSKSSLKRLINRNLVKPFSTDAWDILPGLIQVSIPEPEDHFVAIKKRALSRKWLAAAFCCFAVVAAIAGFIATIKSILE